ncbi:MAG TPA: hypothetical protein DEG17_00755 [Cyanobacteria bacterium UBA11149]|uniref:Uncharacterized protein n=1 Tax=Limnofasciculus baicalensis BBK-W-15 TaxID=2699891 RepID=A0AAE3GNI2_9CYAN|nr:hypothetical protein [Limnofasciculus baicalensis]HBE17365.1 hypothetical protein [Cyanobacteria bacterium UBA11367]HBE58416.1 hypothetical protein [Cyanobacteria bacterium UBA11366]HBK64330.1 hypothetical protein [Cyanobacteria bacterium UBA11166]HBR75790.1 hypothetical protein [Cyanobacteria bacterium UBA11159]HBS71080.1 hypothetical protein [Cyanobacteria bacterium UBA11153]HBW87443.1 hypothetical protein [Cyanobacteria bacterium UBA11149]HCA97695.1 hypothetical protein [Cyanobacteria 
MTVAIAIPKVYDEMIEFIAAGTTSQSLINFQLSDSAQERLEDLVYRHKTGELTPEEKKELDYFLILEHIMTLIKARAYKYIKSE